MLQRQVYRMPRAGSISDLRLQTEELPAPAPDEVCVQVHAVGLNFADIFAMQGLYSATPQGSFIPGLEFSGVVIAVGEGVKEWKAGDRVMGATKFGGYVSHINIGHRYIIRLPEAWTFEEGAGYLVQGLTAYYALTRLGNLQQQMTVLIHSAAGGVGIMANRICKKWNAYTIGTVGNAQKKAFLLQQEGYNAVIVRGNDFGGQLRAELGDRALLLVMECIGGNIFRESWKVMAPMGRLIAYGSASFTSHGAKPDYLLLIGRYLRRPRVDPLRLPSQNKSLMGFNLIYLYEQTDLMHTLLGELLSLQLRPQHVGHVFPFPQMHDAIRLFQKGETVGKVVVNVDQ